MSRRCHGEDSSNKTAWRAEAGSESVAKGKLLLKGSSGHLQHPEGGPGQSDARAGVT